MTNFFYTRTVQVCLLSESVWRLFTSADHIEMKTSKIIKIKSTVATNTWLRFHRKALSNQHTFNVQHFYFIVRTTTTTKTNSEEGRDLKWTLFTTAWIIFLEAQASIPFFPVKLLLWPHDYYIKINIYTRIFIHSADKNNVTFGTDDRLSFSSHVYFCVSFKIKSLSLHCQMIATANGCESAKSDIIFSVLFACCTFRSRSSFHTMRILNIRVCVCLCVWMYVWMNSRE